MIHRKLFPWTSDAPHDGVPSDEGGGYQGGPLGRFRLQDAGEGATSTTKLDDPGESDRGLFDIV